jgi:hypothetical protein
LQEVYCILQKKLGVHSPPLQIVLFQTYGSSGESTNFCIFYDSVARWGRWGDLTGVGFLHLGGVKTVEIVNRSRRKRTKSDEIE